MRRLVLMRHAKTEANNVGGDKARRLKPSGVQDAQEAGRELAGLGLQYALVSTAQRTRETFAALGLDIPAEYQDALYYQGTETMLQRIGETDPEVTGLLVVGHAPTIPSLVAELAYASNRAEADQAQGAVQNQAGGTSTSSLGAMAKRASGLAAFMKPGPFALLLARTRDVQAIKMTAEIMGISESEARDRCLELGLCVAKGIGLEEARTLMTRYRGVGARARIARPT